MKKILFGFAFLAGLASCSKDEPTNGGENTENGKYKLYLHYKADYSSSEDRYNAFRTSVYSKCS